MSLNLKCGIEIWLVAVVLGIQVQDGSQLLGMRTTR